MKFKRSIRILLTAIASVLILTAGIKLITDQQFRKQIPQIPDDPALTSVVKEQVTGVRKKARRYPSAKNLGTLGMVFHSAAMSKEAAECYRLAIKKDKTGWIWNYYLGCLNIEMSEPEAAIENFNAVMDKKPRFHQALYYLGETYRMTGKNNRAKEAFSKIPDPMLSYAPPGPESRRDYFPLKAYAKFQLARIYLDSGSSDQAEKTLKEITRDNQLFGPAYRMLGNIYLSKGDSSAGNSFILRANDMTTYSTPIDTILDKVVLLSRSEFVLLKQIDEAVLRSYPEWALKLIDHSLLYLPDNKYLISKAVYAFLRSNQAMRAISLIPKHINAYQDDYAELKNTGYLFYQNGFYPQSEMYYHKAAQIRPDDPDVEFCLVLCKWKEGEKPKALEMINSQLEKNPTDVKVLTNCVNALMYIGEKEAAGEHLRQLRRLAPAEPEALKMAGMLAESNGNLPEAATLYETSLKGNPEDLAVIRSLGNILIGQKMWKKSVLHFRKALERYPNDPIFQERLGTLLISCPETGLRNLNEGMEYSHRAFTSLKSNVSTVVAAGKSLANGYSLLGDRQNAYTTINMALTIAHQNNLPEAEISALEQMLSRLRN